MAHPDRHRPKPKPPPPELSAEERAAIHHAVDEHFTYDYRPGSNPQVEAAIAEIANCPRGVFSVFIRTVFDLVAHTDDDTVQLRPVEQLDEFTKSFLTFVHMALGHQNVMAWQALAQVVMSEETQIVDSEKEVAMEDDRCRRCGQLFKQHGIYNEGPVPEGAQLADFEGWDLKGVYCPSELD